MSRRGNPKIMGDHTPVTGVGRSPGRLLRSLPALAASVPRGQLSKHIRRLLSLHPQALGKFTDVNLTTMSMAAKKTLLAEINGLLGVTTAIFPKR
jgi:hypothetical protein